MKKELEAVDGETLWDMEFGAQRFCIRGLLPQGLCILGGASKIGKSWLVLDWVDKVAKGEPVWKMETTQGSKSSLDTFMEDLVRMNGEAMAALEEVPYQPIVYAVPKEWVESGKTLLENAVQFQPTLYSNISTLATQKEMQEQRVQLKADLEVAKREILKEFGELKKQAGSAKESISASLSKDHASEVDAIKEEYESQQKKRNRLMWITISASAALSGLVSGLCQLLVG